MFGSLKLPFSCGSMKKRAFFNRLRRGYGPSDFHSYPTALPAGRVVDFACKINSLYLRTTSGWPKVPSRKSGKNHFFDTLCAPSLREGRFSPWETGGKIIGNALAVFLRRTPRRVRATASTACRCPAARARCRRRRRATHPSRCSTPAPVPGPVPAETVPGR